MSSSNAVDQCLNYLQVYLTQSLVPRLTESAGSLSKYSPPALFMTEQVLVEKYRRRLQELNDPEIITVKFLMPEGNQIEERFAQSQRAWAMLQTADGQMKDRTRGFVLILRDERELTPALLAEKTMGELRLGDQAFVKVAYK